MNELNKVKDDNFFVGLGWMRRAGLKGNELIIFAIIYGFSQLEDQCFKGSLQYLQQWTGLSKPAVISILKKLQEKNYIDKTDKFINGVKFCEYRSLPLVKKINQGGKEILPGGGKETLHNNIDIDIYRDNIDLYPPKTPEPDYEAIIDSYNHTCKSLPQVKKITDGRKKAIRGILKKYTAEELEKAFTAAEQSDFLSGRKGGWSASFDWLMKDANLAKVLEGNYSNRTGHAPQGQVAGSIFAGLREGA